MDKIKLNIPDTKEIQIFLDKIKEILFLKGQMQGRRQDAINKTVFGEIQFWFQADVNNQYFLVFDKNPQEWDVKKVKLDILKWEQDYYSM